MHVAHNRAAIDRLSTRLTLGLCIALTSSLAHAGIILELAAAGEQPGRGFIRLADDALEADGIFRVTDLVVEGFLFDFPGFQVFLPEDLRFSPAMNYEVAGGELVGLDIHAVFALTSAFWELSAFDPDPSRALAFGTAVDNGLTAVPGGGFLQHTVTISRVPEPGSSALMLTGLLGLTGLRRSRSGPAQQRIS